MRAFGLQGNCKGSLGLRGSNKDKDKDKDKDNLLMSGIQGVVTQSPEPGAHDTSV